MNLKFMQNIVDRLNNSPRGMTIMNLMDATKLARGTIKPLLDILVYTSQVDVIEYHQNVKVYFANIKKIRKKVSHKCTKTRGNKK